MVVSDRIHTIKAGAEWQVIPDRFDIKGTYSRSWVITGNRCRTSRPTMSIIPTCCRRCSGSKCPPNTRSRTPNPAARSHRQTVGQADLCLGTQQRYELANVDAELRLQPAADRHRLYDLARLRQSQLQRSQGCGGDGLQVVMPPPVFDVDQSRRPPDAPCSAAGG